MPEYRPIPRTSKALDDDEITWTRQPGESVSVGEWRDDPRDGFVYCEVAIRFPDDDIFRDRVQSCTLMPSREMIAKLVRNAITKLRAWHYIDHHAA